MYHHARFIMRTKEAPGWVSQFRELVMDLDAKLHDLRGNDPAVSPALDPDSYVESQALAKALRAAESDGLVYPSVRVWRTVRWALLPRSRAHSGSGPSSRLPIGTARAWTFTARPGPERFSELTGSTLLSAEFASRRSSYMCGA